MEKERSIHEAFPPDLSSKVLATIEILVKENCSSLSVKWDGMEQNNSKCPISVHEILGVLEKQKLIFMAYHTDLVRTLQKTIEEDKKQQP